ncbi:mitochondrial inner membrane protease ATP23 [Aspergillus fumigatus Af293]|uniref:Mitochondrial inner membrane protease ATP23 n=1 Tax=Aspergillus fumigatus (strain CBS 144.89 / FGSC A1163 / CEA10) TaxID=451804 RepID=B0XW53_ASPFC|nr:Ku70-binding protein, putative [Aspergillus fumigatus Af293]EAL93054.1 Ku70-binding protein, putative [Aspergillus fumigatus Af293]EDP54305.1 Ku70-binding protein, putative [Aspergillus fumigatus A1163]
MSDSQPCSTPSTRGKSDSGYIPGDDTWTQWRNIFAILTGQMTDEGKEQFRIARDIRNEAADCKRCEDQRDYLLQYRGDLSSHNIYCRRCTSRKAGGFDPEYGILLCANEMKDQGHLEDTMAHEMVHAYDHLRFKVDWTDNLRHAACTEIRASSLSGECRWAREFFRRGQWKFTQQHQECVRRRAILSVRARPGCKDEAHAEKVVNEVWDSCFRDTRPFDEIYR